MAINPIRVLVVDDSAVVRASLRRVLESDAEIKVVDIARNGQEAVELVQKYQPDLVTLDIEMPVKDGRTALREILQLKLDSKPAVLMCSSLTTAGSKEAIRALTEGASDFIGKPNGSFGSLDDVKDELLTKIKAICSTRRPHTSGMHIPSAAPSKRTLFPEGRAALVTVASSTGGPPIVEEILKALPANMPVPIIIAQHMPLLFTTSLAQRLNEVAQIHIIQGEHGMAVKPGNVYLAPGGSHTRVIKRFGSLQLEVNDEPRGLFYKPSADELFRSCAEAVNEPTLGIVLTGIGQDGTIGAETIKSKGGWIGAQNAKSCVVYGMPRAVAEKKLTDFVGTASELASMIMHLAGPANARACA
ncbi:MAG: chemotaxis response regulator protein-glutamate methylesterase [Phycisphaeraceae bacterium]|nr:chemotaxis response regulator protein-glutamate methylesterase [Phycisphaerales bacterium]MCB9860341.1 chemotaxis response regulator protein-glutamate methylesterase [Phycisphaeraceae bacterium]